MDTKGGHEADKQAQQQAAQAFMQKEAVRRRMGVVKHKILVLSGKGGVGKSTVAANLAVSLARAGCKVGLLDIDIHGPNIPQLLGLEGQQLRRGETGLVPASSGDNLKVMSIAFLLRSQDDAVIWRGPMKHGAIREFLSDVEWGELDYLVVDSPPGTGDEPLSIVQLVENPDGAVIVTTPQDVSLADVRRSINFCRQLKLPVLGVVENMSGFVCPHCGLTTDVFGSGGGQRLAESTHVPFLGRIPLDPNIVESGDAGKPIALSDDDTPTARAMREIADAIVEEVTAPAPPAGAAANPHRDPIKIKIAIPAAGGKLSAHFGHCDEFVIFEVDPQQKTILSTQSLATPDHEPGLLPRWLKDKGVGLIIAGGIGTRAQGLFAENGIRVVSGAPTDSPDALANAYLDGNLETGDNICDH